MPIDPATAMLISGGVQTGGGFLQSFMNRKFQREQNELDRYYEQQMYLQQRKDSVSDFDRVNAYNHPSQQMQRLREAGLNPNLVYGKGADNTATMIKGAEFKPNSKPAPQMDIMPALNAGSNAIMGYQQVKMQQQQTDNLQKQAALIEQEQALKQAQTVKALEETARTKEQTRQLTELWETTLENAKLKNTKLEADTIFTLDENERQELMNKQNIQESIQRIVKSKIDALNVQSQTSKNYLELERIKKDTERLEQLQKLLKQETLIKEAQANLWKLGINPNDPTWMRMLAQMLMNLAKKYGYAE